MTRVYSKSYARKGTPFADNSGRYYGPPRIDGLLLLETTLLESPDVSPTSDTEHVEPIQVLSLRNEFREVMAVRVNQQKFRKGIV